MSNESDWILVELNQRRTGERVEEGIENGAEGPKLFNLFSLTPRRDQAWELVVIQLHSATNLLIFPEPEGQIQGDSPFEFSGLLIAVCVPMILTQIRKHGNIQLFHKPNLLHIRPYRIFVKKGFRSLEGKPVQKLDSEHQHPCQKEGFQLPLTVTFS